MTRFSKNLPVSVVFLAACVLLLPGVALGAEIDAESRIDRVTVYVDQADVTRTATVQVPAGASTIAFSDIPIVARPDSIRVSASGVPASLGTVEMDEDVRPAEESDARRAPGAHAGPAEADRRAAQR